MRFAQAVARWAKAGFSVLPGPVAADRQQVCRECSHWLPKGYLGLGKCTACGCSGLKLWLPTETCPKWRPFLPHIRQSEPLTKPGQAAGLIIDHYLRVQPMRRQSLPDLAGYTIFQLQNGLGDTLMLTDIARAGIPVRSKSPHAASLGLDFPPSSGPSIELFDLYWHYDCGPGHLLQRLRRACKLSVDPLPRPCIPPAILPQSIPNRVPRVILHLEAGQHAKWQRKHIHPLARQIYPSNISILERFIADHSEWEFCQIGRSGHLLRGARNCIGLPLRDTIHLMAGSTLFLGIISGPMHLAAALGMRSIVIVNLPDPGKIFLPTLVSTGQVEEEWFYPQNVHLHQDASGPLVPHFTRRTLDAALAGEVYPYWTHDYLSLL